VEKLIKPTFNRKEITNILRVERVPCGDAQQNILRLVASEPT
jgi:hypothetical protein